MIGNGCAGDSGQQTIIAKKESYTGGIYKNLFPAATISGSNPIPELRAGPVASPPIY
jgi:hypothetical protein